MLVGVCQRSAATTANSSSVTPSSMSRASDSPAPNHPVSTSMTPGTRLGRSRDAWFDMPCTVPTQVDMRGRSGADTRGVVTRAEGYAAARGKEEAGLLAVLALFRDVTGLTLTRVPAGVDNMTLGDLTCGWDRYVEVKRQPVDPRRYARNFVEVCEESPNPRHRNGLEVLADQLGVPVDTAAGWVWRRPASSGGQSGRVGDLVGVSASLGPAAGGATVVYVNPGGQDAPAWAYAYTGDALIGLVREQMGAGRAVRGAGRSNEYSIALSVPVPGLVWTADRAGAVWRFAGRGDAGAAAATLSRLVTF